MMSFVRKEIKLLNNCYFFQECTHTHNFPSSHWLGRGDDGAGGESPDHWVAFCPSDNSTRTFQSVDTGSKKRLVLVTMYLKVDQLFVHPKTVHLIPGKVGPTVSPYHMTPL